MIIRPSLRLFYISLIPFLISACADQKTDVSSIGNARGLKYTVMSKTEALADGFTDLTVEILVEDLLGHVISGVTPPVKSIEGSGVNFTSCVPSNPSGIAVCTFRSQLEGGKTIAIGSATQAVIQFNPIASKSVGQFGIVPSIQINQVASDGSFVSSSVGNITDRPKQRSPSWVVFTDPAIRQ